MENELLAPKLQNLRGIRGYAPPENLENLGLLECISCILEQELGYLNRKGNTIAVEITQNVGKIPLFFLNKILADARLVFCGECFSCLS